MNGKEKLLLTKLIRYAMEHSSPEALKKYLKDHPNADASKHTVKGEGDGGKGGPEKSISVEDAQKAFDKADKAVKDLGLSDSEVTWTKNLLEDMSKNGYTSSDFSEGANVLPGGWKMESLMDKLEEEIGGGINVLGAGFNDDIKKSIEDLMDMSTGLFELTPEEAMSPKKTKAKIKEYREGLSLLLNAADRRGVDTSLKSDLEESIREMLDGIEKNVNKDLDPARLEAVSKMTEASKSLASAKAKAPKEEKAKSKGKGKGKGGPEKSTSVEDAQKAFDKADKAVKDLGLSVGDISDIQNDLRNGWGISLESRGLIPAGGDEAYELLGNVKLLAGGESLSDLASKLDKDLADKIDNLNGMITGRDDFKLTPEDLKDTGSITKKFDEYRDGIEAVAGAMSAIGRGSKDINQAKRQMKQMVDSLERDVSGEINLREYYEVSKMTEASKSLASAKAKAPKEEKEEKKEESKPTKEEKAKTNKQKRIEEKAKSKSKGKGKGKSKSLDEMSAAELKAQAEEALKNSDMDPEEKKKAIKRMKKKSPADLKAMLSSMGDDEEGEDSGGKKAFLRRSAQLGSEIKANSDRINRLQALNRVMGELQHNQRRIASLKDQLRKYK